MRNEVSITCRLEFSASHHYRILEWSEQENREQFGMAANPKGHGHNYVVEVTLAGDVNSVTGMVINIADLKKGARKVIEELDHKNLNEEVSYFQSCLPTTENLACYLFERISQNLSKEPARRVDRIRVYENEYLYSEYLGERF